MRTYVFLACIIAAFSGNAQIYLTLTITPQNPTPTDMVNINATVILPDGCTRLDSSITRVNDSIFLTGCYLYDINSGGGLGHDTLHFRINPLPNGTYHVKYTVHASGAPSWDTTCTTFSKADSTYKSFTVGPAGISEALDKPIILQTVVINELLISYSGTMHVELWSIEGKKVIESEKRTNTVALDVSSLSRGFYIVTMQTQSDRYSRKIFKE